MKTLKYKILGKLRVGDTGPEAAVGDQVKLYLDTDANSSFPEFIVGVIQHPIESISCDTYTLYSVEYDEVDLTGSGITYLREDDVVDTEVINNTDLFGDAIEAETAAREALIQTGTFTNATGNTTITIPAGCERYTVFGTFTGVASTRIIILDLTNAVDGCEIELVSNLPATEDIVVEFRNATDVGTLLDIITTDTSGDNATLRFGFTTFWNKISTLYPN